MKKGFRGGWGCCFLVLPDSRFDGRRRRAVENVVRSTGLGLAVSNFWKGAACIFSSIGIHGMWREERTLDFLGGLEICQQKKGNL